MSDSDQTPFRQVVDDLTDGCGCACHTGLGYNASCQHCAGSVSITVATETQPTRNRQIPLYAWASDGALHVRPEPRWWRLLALLRRRLSSSSR